MNAPDLQGSEVVRFFRNEFPELTVFSQILDLYKGESGRSREGYHAYEHGLEVSYLFHVVLANLGFSKADLRLALVAASLHDFDVRAPKTAPKVARTFEQIDENAALLQAFNDAGVSPPEVKLLIYRTDFPWTDTHRETFDKMLALMPSDRQEGLREMAEILQLIDKSSAAFSLPPEGYEERVRKGLYDEEWHQNVSPEKYRALSLAFFEHFLLGDPAFARVRENLPAWALENWRRLNEDLRRTVTA
jgi:hypothetical protein